MTTYEDEIRLDIAPDLRLTVAYELDPSANRSRVRTRVDRLDADEATAPEAEGPGEGTTPKADAAGGDGVDAAESQATFELFRDAADEWRWRLRHRNGNVIASSGEGYTKKANARNGLRSVKRNAPTAPLKEVDWNTDGDGGDGEDNDGDGGDAEE